MAAPYAVPAFRLSMVREATGLSMEKRPTLSAPEEAAKLFMQMMADLDREVFMVAFLSVRNKLIGVHTVSVGCLTQSLVHPREVFKAAFLANAASIVIAHNHPSGDPEPSAEDIAVTRRLATAGALLGVEVLDHVVIADGRFVSLKQRGVL